LINCGCPLHFRRNIRIALARGKRVPQSDDKQVLNVDRCADGGLPSRFNRDGRLICGRNINFDFLIT
jgi:hypothetical protein